MRLRMVSAAGALLVVSVMVTGCGDRHDAGPVPQRAPRASQEVRALTLPLDAFALQLPDLTRVQNAEDALTRTCMARQHLRWPGIHRDPHGSPDQWPNRYRYGLIEPEVARRFGYHPLPDPEADRRSVQYHARQASLSSRQRLAAYGRDGEGGCRAEAVRHLLAGVPHPDWELLNRTSTETYRRAGRTKAVTHALREWSTCMRQHGFAYADPSAAGDDRHWNTTTPTEPEIRTALTDVACKHRSGLVDVWRETESALQRQAVDAHPDAFHALERAKTRYMSNVRTALARPGGQPAPAPCAAAAPAGGCGVTTRPAQTSSPGREATRQSPPPL
ncbi:hypothetical protein [Streptomyces naphthomycinicus]|uniref:hypothetical protein n=1 Tax=Streptomyces naphthomycinicus TaxID=2872625 RepID=UPI001CEC74F4|nr:hypothetical protein [Streptomyces sp. TML10]